MAQVALNNQNAPVGAHRHRGWVVLILDMTISLLASLAAIMFVRWQFDAIPGFQNYVFMWVFVSCLCSGVGFFICATHKIVIRHSTFKSISRLIEAGFVKIAIMALLLWLQVFHFKDIRTETLILSLDFFCSIFLLVSARILLITIVDDMKSDVARDVDRMCVIVYGTSAKSVALLTRLADSSHYIIAGFLTRNKSLEGCIIQDKKVYTVSTEEDLKQLKTTQGFEGILFAKADDSEQEKAGLLSMCLDNGIHVLMAPSVEEVQYNGMTLHSAQSLSHESEFIPDGMNSVERNLKRILDCCLAAVLLIVFAPLTLICWIAVKMEDGGPALFKQERVGRFGRPFNIYKFRSMRTDAEAMGPALYAGDDDPRLTKTGKFLRLHHLDELPQLWNVFVGDMAFIGYRPERQFYIDQIMEADPRYYYLYQIRPGVTSYATLKNGYTDTLEKMLRRLEYDLYYLRHRSLWFDIKILWLTFMNIVGGKKF